MIKMKAQVSMELLTTFGMLIAFSVPVLLLLLSITQYGHENATIAQADATVRLIAENIDFLTIQGSQAKKMLLVNIPSNTKKLQIKQSSHEVILTISSSAGSYDAVAPFYGNATDFELSGLSGLIALTLENKNGVVGISS